MSDGASAVGVADENLVIERISSGALELLLIPAATLLGTPLLGLIAPNDRGMCASAIEEASSTQTGKGIQVEVRTGTKRAALCCDLFILPLLPSPSCSFVLRLVATDRGAKSASADGSKPILHRRHDTEIAQRESEGSFLLSRLDVQARRLTAREYDVVGRLIGGDRVPAIAAKLVLSQSTVRNHLASVFAKLRVSSQQELLDLFRP